MRPLVTFLSDFGTGDPFVGLCHLAVLAEAPDAQVVDLGHAVRPQHVAQGAARLADAVAHTPIPATHLAVVDPGVGSARRATVLLAGGHRLVGPDNGLLVPAAERLGGIAGAWALPIPEEASATFHGRDVFAPVAGRLAGGALPADLGEAVAPAEITRLAIPAAHVAPGSVTAPVRDIDRYGNVQLAATATDLDGAEVGARLQARAGQRGARASRVRTFADLPTGRAGVLVDSFGWVAVTVAGGSAAERLACDLGDTVELTPA